MNNIKIYKIYKIQFPNNKVYIGQTYDISKRWREHLREAASGNDIKVYRAMRKYKIDISAFSIIEDNILTLEEANAKETFYINKFDSWHNGYNCNTGGDNREHFKGENSPMAILSNTELLELRTIRASKQYTKLQVFEFYKDRISFSGFDSYWNYTSRPEIASELNTKDLAIFYHKDKRNLSDDKAPNAKLTNDEVLNIRTDYWIKGKSTKDIWKNYKSLYSLSGIRKIILGNTYKNVPMPIKSLKCKKKAIISKEIVNDIRQKYAEGLKIMKIIKLYYPNLRESVVSNIVHNKTHL